MTKVHSYLSNMEGSRAIVCEVLNTIQLARAFDHGQQEATAHAEVRIASASAAEFAELNGMLQNAVGLSLPRAKPLSHTANVIAFATCS